MPIESELMAENDRLEKFEALLRGHIDALYRTALRSSRDPVVAEDLVQEASLRAYRSFTRGAEPENFRAWIFRILVNLCIDHARMYSARNFGDHVSQEVNDLPEPANGPAQTFENARLGRDLVSAVASLPEDLQMVVELVLIDGMSYRDAAYCMNCPEGTIRSRLNRARSLLRRSLSKHAPDSGLHQVLPFPKKGGLST